MTLKQLQEEVNNKLDIVQNALDKVDQQRQRLSNDALKLKSHISESVEHQINCMKKREQLLLRQVDVGSTQQHSLLSTQHAKLLHCEGALVATSRLLVRCSDHDAPTLAKVQVCEIPVLKNDRMLKSIVVNLDEKKLSSAVSEFGRVHLPDQITQHSSPILPARLEEYGDDDHDILHKSVVPDTSDESITCISVKIPRLPTSDALLLDSNIKNKNVKKHSADIAKWLNTLPSNDECEESSISSIGDLLKDFSIVDSDSNPESTKTSISSSSIEVVSRFSSEKGCGCIDPLCEIENLDRLLEDKSTWQESTCPPTVAVESACCANEPCKSFSDCLCDDACQKNAMDKAMQTVNWKAKQEKKRPYSEVDNSNSISDHLNAILSQEACHWFKRSAIRGNPNGDAINYEMLRQMNNIRKMGKNHWLQNEIREPPLKQSCLTNNSSNGILKTMENISKGSKKEWLKNSSCLTNKTNINLDENNLTKIVKSQNDDWLNRLIHNKSNLPISKSSEDSVGYTSECTKIGKSLNDIWLKKLLQDKSPSTVSKVPENPVDSISECMKVLRTFEKEKWLKKFEQDKSVLLPNDKYKNSHLLDYIQSYEKEHWFNNEYAEQLDYARKADKFMRLQHLIGFDKKNWLSPMSTTPQGSQNQMKMDKLELENIVSEKERVNLQKEKISEMFSHLNVNESKVSIDSSDKEYIGY